MVNETTTTDGECTPKKDKRQCATSSKLPQPSTPRRSPRLLDKTAAVITQQPKKRRLNNNEGEDNVFC